MTVELAGISYTYPGTSHGVADIDLKVEAGELLAVIGASGSGKTTLLKLLAGFLRPQRGRILLDGRDVTELPPSDRQLGIVFQSYALFPHMSAWQNVAYPLKVRSVPAAERRRRALETLALVGLGGFEARAPQSLSGGQQQRVALARALVFDPKALLLDEPLSALDAALRVSMRDEITRVQREAAIATIHVTHDQEEALSMADRIAVVENGRIVQVAEPRALYDRPVTRSVAAFVGQANLWNGRVTAPDEVGTAFGALRCQTKGFQIGDNVTILVRPERVRIGGIEGGLNTFPCSIDRDRFLGSVRRFDAIIDGETVLGETSYRGDIEVISVMPEHAQLLPADKHEATGEEAHHDADA